MMHVSFQTCCDDSIRTELRMGRFGFRVEQEMTECLERVHFLTTLSKS
jgi:hypothetical protein